jgi:hypothetical protein
LFRIQVTFLKLREAKYPVIKKLSNDLEAIDNAKKRNQKESVFLTLQMDGRARCDCSISTLGKNKERRKKEVQWMK